MNYKVVKIGLLNFWYFDDEIMEFYDGKLLLRGGNGSGKSVTMQSFIPLILDGNKMPSRLDPFGTKEKKIEDYLLGPADGNQKDDAIAYLYMECFNESLDKYITIGIGFHAKRGKTTDFWGFALKDGKRVGIDFNLYKNYGGKVLMTKKELRANIGTDNLFVESPKEYKSMVNNLLFGFKDIDSYDEFINVLLQLRSSKLSKEYNPVKLMNILSGVLQPLLEDDIRPLSDAIEENNKTKEKIDVLNSNINALSNLLKVYKNYNEIVLYNKALNVYEINNIIKDNKKNISKYEKNVSDVKNRLGQIDEKIKLLNQEYVEVTTKLASIDREDLEEHTKRLNLLEKEIGKTDDVIKKIKEKIENSIYKEKKSEEDIKKIDDIIYKKDKEISCLITDILSINEDLNIDDVNINVTNKDINFDYLIDKVNKYKVKINSIKIKLEEKEKLDDSLSSLENEIVKDKNELNKKEVLIKNYQKCLNEEIDNFKDNFNLLINKSLVVKIEDNRKKEIFDLIDDYSSSNYIKARDEYYKEIKYFNVIVTDEKYNVENKLKIERDNLKIKQNELDYLLEHEEMEFNDESDIVLKNLNIPFIPLYKVIEFKDDISSDVRGNIEELLISMNILNAKIISNSYFDMVKNINSVFLKKGTYKYNNILKYFNVLENDIMSKSEIENILSCISIDVNDKFYINDNRFELDFLVGFPSFEYKSKYIGLLKRREEHQKKIKEKEKEIDNINKIINNYNNILSNLKEKLNDISFMNSNFPSNDVLEDINTNIIKTNTSMEFVFERCKYLSEEINEISNLIKVKIEEINKLKGNISVPLNLGSFKNAFVLTDEIIKNINNLKNVIDSKNLYNEQKISKNIILDEIKEEIDYQNSELSEKNKLYSDLFSEKKAIEDILLNKDYQNLINEIKNLSERKSSIPKENNLLIEEKGKLKNELDNLNGSIGNTLCDLNMNLIKLDLYDLILNKELDLKYIYDEHVDYNKILGDLKSRENSDITRAFENYYVAFNNYKQELIDYRLMTKDIFVISDELVNIYIEKGLDEKVVRDILSSMSRQDMEANYHGKKLNIYDLYGCLKDAVIESENYINVQERHLFEDILLKTVGNKIRDRIESSKEWVKKMNEIMKNTQFDSNLSFELEWKSKESFSDDELDTKELVRIFKIDAGQLKQLDIDKLSKHFHSQIEKEIEFNESYSNAVFKVLDYRNWFEFKLFYKRKSGERRELTNKVFSILSGGERAKSMYVPLFAAVYAKLLSASSSCLRLVALDEAFAGVDNVNIREMFAILGKLNLDYILTSQVLWGDYDTVNCLSICELIKDEVNHMVGVRRYRWNGKVKEIINGY